MKTRSHAKIEYVEAPNLNLRTNPADKGKGPRKD
jgi:hypothetical protein